MNYNDDDDFKINENNLIEPFSIDVQMRPTILPPLETTTPISPPPKIESPTETTKTLISYTVFTPPPPPQQQTEITTIKHPKKLPKKIYTDLQTCDLYEDDLLTDYDLYKDYCDDNKNRNKPPLPPSVLTNKSLTETKEDSEWKRELAQIERERVNSQKQIINIKKQNQTEIDRKLTEISITTEYFRVKEQKFANNAQKFIKDLEKKHKNTKFGTDLRKTSSTLKKVEKVSQEIEKSVDSFLNEIDDFLDWREQMKIPNKNKKNKIRNDNNKKNKNNKNNRNNKNNESNDDNDDNNTDEYDPAKDDLYQLCMAPLNSPIEDKPLKTLPPPPPLEPSVDDDDDEETESENQCEEVDDEETESANENADEDEKIESENAYEEDDDMKLMELEHHNKNNKINENSVDDDYKVMDLSTNNQQQKPQKLKPNRISTGSLPMEIKFRSIATKSRTPITEETLLKQHHFIDQFVNSSKFKDPNEYFTNNFLREEVDCIDFIETMTKDDFEQNILNKRNYEHVHILSKYTKGIIYAQICKRTQSDESVEFDHDIQGLSVISYDFLETLQFQILLIAKKKNKTDEYIKRLQTFGENYYLKQSYKKVQFSKKLQAILSPGGGKELVSTYGNIHDLETARFDDGKNKYHVCF